MTRCCLSHLVHSIQKKIANLRKAVTEMKCVKSKLLTQSSCAEPCSLQVATVRLQRLLRSLEVRTPTFAGGMSDFSARSTRKRGKRSGNLKIIFSCRRHAATLTHRPMNTCYLLHSGNQIDVVKKQSFAVFSHCSFSLGGRKKPHQIHFLSMTVKDEHTLP